MFERFFIIQNSIAFWAFDYTLTIRVFLLSFSCCLNKKCSSYELHFLLFQTFSHFISILHCTALLYVTIYTYYHTALNTVRNTACNVFFIWMFAYKTQASICFVFILELSLSYYQRPTLPYIPYFLKENVTALLFCHLQALQARPLLLRYYSLPH